MEDSTNVVCTGASLVLLCAAHPSHCGANSRGHVCVCVLKVCVFLVCEGEGPIKNYFLGFFFAGILLDHRIKHQPFP